MFGTFVNVVNFDLIPAWIRNYINYIVRDEMILPFLNFNGLNFDK